MQNSKNVKSFDKKEYNKQYDSTHYTVYSVKIPNVDTADIEKYRTIHGISKSEFVKLAIAYFLENN